MEFRVDVNYVSSKLVPMLFTPAGENNADQKL